MTSHTDDSAGPQAAPVPEAAASRTPAQTASRRGGDPPRAHGRRALWTLTDQVLSSLANFGLTIAVARAVDESVGGIFTYVFLIFTLISGLSRAMATDPLVIRFSAADRWARGRAISLATGAAATMGLAIGVLSLAVGLVVGGELGAALTLLCVVLPGHLLQESWRFAAFASGEPRKAAVNDAVRVVVQFSAIGVCMATGTDDLGWYMGAWAIGVWVAAAVGVRQFGRPVSPLRSVTWVREHAGLSVRLGSDYVINMGSFTLTTSALAALLGFAATGGLRFAQTILGPIQVLFGATTAFMVPLLARRLAHGGPRALRRPSTLTAAAAFFISAAVVVTLLLLPDSLGRELLGESWDEAYAVMAAVGVSQCLNAIAIGGSLPLKAMGRADLLLRVTFVQAPSIIGLGIGGGVLAGIEGAAWGLALSQGIGCVLTVALFLRATGRKATATTSTTP